VLSGKSVEKIGERGWVFDHRDDAGRRLPEFDVARLPIESRSRF
jgi:hypothetical protein